MTRKLTLTVSAAEHARFVEAAKFRKVPLHEWALNQLRAGSGVSTDQPKGKTLVDVFGEESKALDKWADDARESTRITGDDMAMRIP